MKKSKLTDLLDGMIRGAGKKHEEAAEGEGPDTAADEQHAGDGPETDAVRALGEAFLERLRLPDGMSREEAAETVIRMWAEADAHRAEKAEAANEAEAGNEAEAEDETEAPAAEAPDENEDDGRDDRPGRRLPRILRGGIGQAAEADYETMSAEQFRRLRNSLRRASLDGRRIRL